MKAWWNGKLIELSRLRIPLNLEYFQGGNLAENIKVSKGKILRLDWHADRLAEGARALMFKDPDLKGFKKACQAVLRANRLKEANLRIRLFPDLSLLVLPAPAPEKRAGGLKLATVAARHYGPASLQGRLKANSMLPNLLSSWEALRMDAEALRLSPDGYVTEGSWANIVIKRKGKWLTPALHEGILEGTQLRQLGKARKVSQRPLTRVDLYTAEEVYLSNASRGLRRVESLDGRPLRSKKV